MATDACSVDCRRTTKREDYEEVADNHKEVHAGCVMPTMHEYGSHRTGMCDMVCGCIKVYFAPCTLMPH